MANTLYKRIGWVQRKNTLTREQFEAHWLGTHANLCTKLPGMRRYSMNLIEAGRFPHFPYDGFSELWRDSEADLKAALERAEGRTLLADRPNFVEKIDPLVMQEHPKL